MSGPSTRPPSSRNIIVDSDLESMDEMQTWEREVAIASLLDLVGTLDAPEQQDA
jgi:hypothetical protein